MKKAFGIAALAILVIVAVVLAVPSPIDPVAWTPPPAPPMSGVMATNAALADAELIAEGQLQGPEDTAVDSQGRLYAGLQNGRVMRVGRDGRVEIFADTGGRPLGLAFAADGRLIVADAYKGLLAIDPRGLVQVLVREVDGMPLHCPDDLAIARDGRIYFSDASDRFEQPDFLLDLLESRPHGRLLRHDPASGKTEVLLKDLYYANGVALSHDERFVLINETYRYRISRYWLAGETAGSHDYFAENLPGSPDNLEADGNGTFWVALPSPRTAQTDELMPYPWIKAQIAKLPRALRPHGTRYGLVIAMDENGRILRSLQDPTGQRLSMITSVKRVGDVLYFGSLDGSGIGRLDIAGE
jgi:sugar lactone lactonase YvrE